MEFVSAAPVYALQVLAFLRAVLSGSVGTLSRSPKAVHLQAGLLLLLSSPTSQVRGTEITSAGGRL